MWSISFLLSIQAMNLSQKICQFIWNYLPSVTVMFLILLHIYSDDFKICSDVYTKATRLFQGYLMKQNQG